MDLLDKPGCCPWGWGRTEPEQARSRARDCTLGPQRHKSHHPSSQSSTHLSMCSSSIHHPFIHPPICPSSIYPYIHTSIQSSICVFPIHPSSLDAPGCQAQLQDLGIQRLLARLTVVPPSLQRCCLSRGSCEVSRQSGSGHSSVAGFMALQFLGGSQRQQVPLSFQRSHSPFHRSAACNPGGRL